MTDQIATNPVPEAAQVEGQEVAEEAVETTEGEGAQETGEQQVQAGEPETEEVEYNGQKFRVPAPLKGALMMHADYTKKTQEIAENRRTLEQRDAQFAQQVQSAHANIREVAQLVHIDQQLEQLGKVNWPAAFAENRDEAQAAYVQYQELQRTRAAMAGTLEQKQRERALQAQQETAKQLQESRATLMQADPAAEWPGWSPDVAAKVSSFGVQMGLTDGELAQVTDPRHVKILHLAMLGQEVITRQRSAARKTTTATPAKPVPQVGKGAQPATRPLDDRLNTANWMERRNAELRQKSKR